MAKRKNPSSNGGSKDATPSGAAPQEGDAYQVLARKYRPQIFDDLIGQEAMVRTLRNAFASGRIAQAYMLTGVRGVGKTTTARILARALNYVRDGHDDAPTIDMPELGEHCEAIMSSRHMDVLEMDAASHTGVDNIRELIESARYKPVSARYKVYIIDEVHMLSKGAFNALLKTLEEPPPHVKFIFATTEVRKVPVTVLSRCQRFDLKRVDIEQLAGHFTQIAEKEGVSAEDDALIMIARAAEGSVRDGLSLLDQAIALADGKITGEHVRAMIGLADRARIFDLLELVLKGDIAEALAALEALHKDGAEAGQMLADLADAVHIITRIKAAGVSAGGQGLSETEIKRSEELAQKLSMPVLARAWQMLLKGLAEARTAPRAMAAAEMILVRLAYSADLPAPDDLIRKLAQGEAPSAPAPSQENGHGAMPPDAPRQQRTADASGGDAPVPRAHIEQAPYAEDKAGPVRLEDFAAVVAFVGEKRDARLKIGLEEHARLVSYRPGYIELSHVDDTPATLANELAKKLTDWTGERWMVSFTSTPGAPTIREVQTRAFAEELEKVKTHRLVRDVLTYFPGAEIKDIRKAKIEPLLDDSELPDEDTITDDTDE